MTAAEARELGKEHGAKQRATEKKKARTPHGLKCYMRTWVELEWCGIATQRGCTTHLWDDYAAGYTEGYFA